MAMSNEKHPSAGGSYVKASPDADVIFVEGGERKQTPQEKAAAAAAVEHAERAARERAAQEKAAQEKTDQRKADTPAADGEQGKKQGGK